MSDMSGGGWLVLFLVAQRLVELIYAQRNTARLRAAGAVEFGASHYLLIVALHAGWLLALWAAGHDRAIDPFWFAVFAVLPMLFSVRAGRWSASTTRASPTPAG